jgi:hypothetical protein
LLTLLVFYQGDLFRPSRWDGKAGWLPTLAAIFFALTSFIAVVPAWYVVAHYRDKFEETDARL